MCLKKGNYSQTQLLRYLQQFKQKVTGRLSETSLKCFL